MAESAFKALAGAVEAVRRGVHLAPGVCPLLVPEVLHEAHESVISCLGSEVTSTTLFPSTLWYGGATDVKRGHKFRGTISDFVEKVLRARSREVAEKRRGWVATPTTNSDGYRRNSSTTAVNALNLDCDGLGPFDVFLDAVSDLGLAHVVYQSGGWSPTTPKWHTLIPLVRPFDTATDEGVSAWRRAYAVARAAFGALAKLPGVGFDPSTDTPSVPVFVTERRIASDPPREVFFKTGKALDLEMLSDMFPEPPRERREVLRENLEIVLDDGRFEDVVSILSVATESVHSGRRDLYLALPGALLDRGVEPDDVLAICEEVSARYRGGDDEKHRDNVRAARTTIARHEADLSYTRIGTLARVWPEVARALDEAFPEWVENQAALAKVEVEEFLNELSGRGSTTAPREIRAVVEPRIHPISVQVVRAALASASRSWRSSTDSERQIRGRILRQLLDGENLVPKNGVGVPEVDEHGLPWTPARVVEAVSWAAIAVTRVPVATDFEIFREIARRSLVATATETDTIDRLVTIAKTSFSKSLLRRVERGRRDLEQQEGKRNQIRGAG